VATKGWQPIVTDGMRQQAQADLAYWHASVIVLDDGGPGSRWTTNQAKLLEVATELFGTPQRVDGVWLWQVNPAPPSELASGR
jgi:hypothetical protein